MRRIILILVVCVTSFFVHDWCEAQCFRNGWTRFWHSVKTGYHENHHWPNQHTPKTRSSTMHPINMMVQKGWKQQNTLTEYHFDATGNDLNQAGQYKVYDILFNTPKSHRSIYVFPGEKKLITDHRIRSVQLEASKYLPSGEQIEVGVSRDLPYPPTSEVVQRIQELSLESMKPPVISSGDEDGGGDDGQQATTKGK